MRVVGSPRDALPRTASVDVSVYGGSTNTYQSIEGLNDCCSCSHHHRQHHRPQQQRCSSRASSSCRRSTHSRSSGRYRDRSSGRSAGSLYSLGRSCCHDARVAPMEGHCGGAAPGMPLQQAYRPNFYGWVSPPGSPSLGIHAPRRQVSLESDALLRGDALEPVFASDGTTLYGVGGSVRSDGDYWCGRDLSSVYGGSVHSSNGGAPNDQPSDASDASPPRKGLVASTPKGGSDLSSPKGGSDPSSPKGSSPPRTQGSPKVFSSESSNGSYCNDAMTASFNSEVKPTSFSNDLKSASFSNDLKSGSFANDIMCASFTSDVVASKSFSNDAPSFPSDPPSFYAGEKVPNIDKQTKL